MQKTILFSLVVVFAVSTACLTLFPDSPEPLPSEEQDERGSLKFDPPSLPDAKVGVPYDAQIEVTENVTPVGEFIVDPEALPPGLELNMDEAVHDIARITGIPEKAGTYTFTVSVWCYGTMVNGQVGAEEYTIAVE